MDEIRQTFFLECEDLLQALMEGLAAIEGGDEDPETVNAWETLALTDIGISVLEGD